MRPMKWMRTPGVRFLFLCALAACGDGAGPDEVARVDASAGDAELWVGDTTRVQAVARGANGETLERVVTWTSSNPAVATVDGAGKVTATGPGGAVLTASAGGRTGTVEIAVSTYDLLYEVRWPSNVAEPMVLRLDGGAPQRVLPAVPWAADPVPSPDGSRIAFVVRVPEYESSDIWIANRDGSGLARLTESTEIDDQPTWSPDGQKIAFRSYASERGSDIWIMNPDGSGKRQLTPDPLPGITYEMRPAWSPDGTRIAYARALFDQADLCIIPAAGGEAVCLTSTTENDTEPAWSPDGTRIVFRRNFAGDSDLMFISPEGGQPTRLQIPGYQFLPAWSPDGQLIAFSQSSGPGDAMQLRTIRPDGSQNTLRTTDPAWGGGANASFLRRGN
ncbi:Ig-like domain-containing protein [Longimicrobium sp.]|uniref:Ig-like domain-containing protein n=1 Tax=Longimicrobium sp. TaxID=2029185 RepID=UPI002E350329|nr:Ig-like domain-containing protein [Longimicrobium sp.]HEX6039445.1 Ig-like domain-containing protein [Longimicrobium sp.]